jgi:hypothetical protein
MILLVMVCSNPLRTLIAIIKVATPSAIPIIEIKEIKLMNRESFLESIKFLAMNQEKCID